MQILNTYFGNVYLLKKQKESYYSGCFLDITFITKERYLEKKIAIAMYYRSR